VTKDTPVSKFNGDLIWVQIEIGKAAEDLNHLKSPEERFKVAMLWQ
jgi:arylsulfatase